MSLTQLAKLLPLPPEDLQQVLDYAATLSKEEVSDHFKDLLGSSLKTTEFIAAFNSQRQSSESSIAPAFSGSTKKNQKKKAPLHKPPLREVHGPNYGTPYQKKNEEDYMVISKSLITETPSNGPTMSKSQPRAPPSAAGPLISDFDMKPPLKKKQNLSKSNTLKNSSKSASKTKVVIAGGKALHGESTTISELDAAIRALEISTNSKLESSNPLKRACNCIGARHPVLTAAPNCLSCGKVICVMEGLGPCTFCGTPLLSSTEVKSMISQLRGERGREKMLLNNKNQRRTAVKSFSASKNSNNDIVNQGNNMKHIELEAQAHRDKLLSFQSQNTIRTTIRDEVTEFNTNESEVRRDTIWATPTERASALKAQQKLLKEIEWQARPEYDRKKVVVSLECVNGKVVKRIQKLERERDFDVVQEENEAAEGTQDEINGLKESPKENAQQTFRNNPLLGKLIRPVWTAKVEKITGKNEDEKTCKVNSWRRVQDDQEDNENLILDGGISSWYSH
ncbi:Uncharacterized protein C1A6.01c [Golovinomyces cichoracearum]|uniref:Uncharacterized protein C1A6.01c n=1 Tax=Golovinomyces cichoracearum TaxID=62708 RepID=A0A420II34_9PEZI|nr:Uncharacterized protein C1A6.01c [Golovinomyces cichoracearum]